MILMEGVVSLDVELHTALVYRVGGPGPGRPEAFPRAWFFES